MGINIPKTVEEIEKSAWFRKLNKPELVAGLESAAEAWLRKHGTKSQMGRQLHAALVMYRQSKAGHMLTPRNVAILTFSILYVVCPVDAIADIVPVIGWLDDIGILTVAFSSILSSMGKPAENQAEETAPCPETDFTNTPT